MRASAAFIKRRRAAGAMVILSLLVASCTEAPGPAGCQGEVVAAFRRLKTSGRPYREETVMVVNGQGGFREAFEFVAPDRRRQVTDNGVPGDGPVETIQVGARTWFRESRANGGWSDWERSETDLTAQSVREDVPADQVFACLGEVEFNGKTYIGYRAKVTMVFFSLRAPGPRDQKAEEEQLARLRQVPQEWRTVFLEVPSLLPVYDIQAPENQLDRPRISDHYTYPDGIKIEPPDR